MPANGETISFILEDPTIPKDTFELNERGVRPRRAHTKSRNGCDTCKRRRIKCDEAKPTCAYCLEKGVPCDYPASKLMPPHLEHNVPTTGLNKDNVIPASTRERIIELLEKEHVSCDHVTPTVYIHSDAIEILHHFLATTDLTWIGSRTVQNLMQRYAIDLALDASYLLNAILAFSAAHLGFLSPDLQKYRVAATCHYQRSLEQFHECLGGDLTRQSADTMFAASMLHTMLAFVHSRTGLPEDHVDVEAPALPWVRSMLGTDVLLRTTSLRNRLYQGIWSPLIRSYAEWDDSTAKYYLGQNPKSEENVTQIHRLIDIFSQLETTRRTLYEAPLSMLEQLGHLPPTSDVVGRFILFIVRLSVEFHALLDCRDPYALLIMGYWCALLGRIDQWWIAGPARMECKRISDEVASHHDAAAFSPAVSFLREFIDTNNKLDIRTHVRENGLDTILFA